MWVFPGTIQVSSANRYIDLTAPSVPLMLDALTDTTNRPSIQPVASLNDAGRQAALAALDAKVHYCYKGGPLPADCCSNGKCARVPPDPGTSDAGIDPDSITIISFESAQDMTYDFDPIQMRVHVSGRLNYSAQGQRFSQPTKFRQVLYLRDAMVDISKEPPVWVRAGT